MTLPFKRPVMYLDSIDIQPMIADAIALMDERGLWKSFEESPYRQDVHAVISKALFPKHKQSVRVEDFLFSILARIKREGFEAWTNGPPDKEPKMEGMFLIATAPYRWADMRNYRYYFKN
jgi:hypothetical protein